MIMRFIGHFLLAFALYMGIFCLILLSVLGAVWFIDWELPAYQSFLDKLPTTLRVLSVLSAGTALWFMFSPDGRKSWRV